MAKPGILEHPKLFKLGRLLGIDPGLALGPLEGFLHFVARSYPSGDVTRVDPEILVDAIRCPSVDPERFWQALVAAEFVDALADGRRVVHDWPEHCNDAVHMALARKGQFFWDGTQPRTTRFGGAERARIEGVYAQKSACQAQESADDSTASARQAHGKRTANTPPSPPLPCPKNDEEVQPEPRFEEPSSSSSSPPLEMPDGTQRLTDGQFEALDGLRRDFTDALVLSSSVQAKFRKLLADGATVALIDEMVREAALSQRRKHGGKWRASRLDYFEPAVRRRLDELRQEGAGAAPAPSSRPPPDPEQRSIRRAALLRAAARGQEGDFSEGCEAFAAWLEGLGWEPEDVRREVAALAAEVRAEARGLKGTENGRPVEGNRRPGAADAEPAHSGG